MTIILPFDVDISEYGDIYYNVASILNAIGLDNSKSRRLAAELLYIIAKRLGVERKRKKIAYAIAYIVVKIYAPEKTPLLFKKFRIKLRDISLILFGADLMNLVKTSGNNIVMRHVVNALEKLDHMELLNTCLTIYLLIKDRMSGKKPRCLAGGIIDLARLLHGTQLTMRDIAKALEISDAGIRIARRTIMETLGIEIMQTAYFMPVKIRIPSILANQLNINNPIVEVVE